MPWRSRIVNCVRGNGLTECGDELLRCVQGQWSIVILGFAIRLIGRLNRRAATSQKGSGDIATLTSRDS